MSEGYRGPAERVGLSGREKYKDEQKKVWR